MLKIVWILMKIIFAFWHIHEKGLSDSCLITNLYFFLFSFSKNSRESSNQTVWRTFLNREIVVVCFVVFMILYQQVSYIDMGKSLTIINVILYYVVSKTKNGIIWHHLNIKWNDYKFISQHVCGLIKKDYRITHHSISSCF